MGVTTESGEKEEHLVAFRLAGETYAVDISLVQEIIRMCAITCLPRCASELEGVINLRGKIVPIVDVKQRLGLAPAPRDDANKIVVVHMDDVTVGLVVDSVVGVIKIPGKEVEPPCELIGSPTAGHVRAVAKRGGDLVVLLDLRRALGLEAVG